MDAPTPPPGAALVRLAARLVPDVARGRWQDEWVAELAWAWEHPRSDLPPLLRRLALVGRAWGAFSDALAMRRTVGGDPVLGRDLAFAVRVLARHPVYSALVAFTLALGIGATTAVFTVVDAALLRPLPFRDVERLVTLEARLSSGATTPHLQPELVAAWQAHPALMDAVARYGNRALTLEQGEPRDLRGIAVSDAFFPLLGVPARLGRTFAAEEFQDGARVVVVSDAFWRSVLGADPAAVGRTLLLSGERYAVVGVMPPTFRFPRGEVALWLPLPARPDAATARGRLQAFGRLAEGVTVAAAQRRADVVAPQLAAARPELRSASLRLEPLGSWRANADLRRVLAVLAGTVACVLLIACANAANLLLVRATAGRRELTVRVALGAARARVVRELLAEAGVLALAGGALGVALAHGGVAAMVAIAPPELVLWSYGPIAISGRVLAFSVATSALTVLLFGTAPAARATRLGAPLGRGERAGSGGREQRHFLDALVVGQIALSFMLLVGAGLLVHSFARLWRVTPGMEVDRLALVDVAPSARRYASVAARARFYEAVTARIRSMPGVEAVSVVSGLAGGAGSLHFGTALEIEGGGGPAGGDPELLPFGEGDASYFRTLGIAIRQGRGFEDADLTPEASTVVVDEDLARHLWPDGTAVGRRFRVDAQSPWLTVVGVAGDVRLQGPDERRNRFELYYPVPLGTAGQRTLAVRTVADPAMILPLLKSAVHAVDPLQPILEVTTAAQRYRDSMAKPRFLLALMTTFAGVAATLALIGLYGVIAYAVAQRTREIGVRMALGARREHVVGAVVREGARLVAGGMALGLGAALVLGRFVSSFLYGVTPTDPVTLAAVVVAFGGVATLAAYLPARRASRIDPVVSIRAE